MCVENVDLLLKNGHNLSATTHTPMLTFSIEITWLLLQYFVKRVFYVSFLFSVTFFTLFFPIPCTHISLRKWRKKCAFGIDKNEWPDETSQKGCDLSLNHLTLFMANMRVSVHDTHMLANKNMFQTNSLWKFILCRL